ncbi:MAG: hypothetical protein AUH43_20810 [Acidobacteria bacterium 13_1_40CM_65_14]|nr:MAG: hypothetical protein AUH43_20810 [Acidobacteria bacterium 13_1_40CM_65_14]
MRGRRFVAITIVLAWSAAPRAADPPRRKPLDPNQRAALVVLMNAVDVAQQRDADADASLTWDNHILKSRDQTAYVPFRVTVAAATDAFKSTAMYVRAVSRHDGARTADEHSAVRDWLARGGDAPPPRIETVFVGPGELPVGGPAASSARRSTQAPAEASAILGLQQRAYEKQKAADEAAKKRAEKRERDPYLFPFEEYYFFDLEPSRASDPRLVERALALPPGEYDVYVALLDRARQKASSPAILRRTVTIPDYWNDRLALSSLILVSRINTLKAPLSHEHQIESPYTLGQAEVVPVATHAFTSSDVLSVVFQICNYGAPDADLTAEYNFFHEVDGTRRLFNRTPPQHMTDDDLPPPSPWETQAFTSQSVPLHSFPPGKYELEVTVRDRLTRSTAKETVAFTVR